MSNWKTTDGVAETVMTYEEWKREFITYPLKKRTRRFVRRLHKNKRTIKSAVKGIAVLGAIVAAMGCAGNADMKAEGIRTANGYYANGYFFDYDGNCWQADETWHYFHNESVRLQFDTNGTEDVSDDTLAYVNEWNLPRFVGKTKEYSGVYTVVSIDPLNNIVTVKGNGGNYAFEGENWRVGDVLTAVMSDNATENNQDDFVVSTCPVEDF